MKSLTGFRDFDPDDCARRDYLLGGWRSTAKRYGFLEYDGPVLESIELYEKKNRSDAEILTQLYTFSDKGGRRVALRPEMTPTLARMMIARNRTIRKPAKWFSIATFYRYERPQKGRLREFIQFNADIVGDHSSAGTAELIALSVDILRGFGFTARDFVVRISDRNVWLRFLESVGCVGSAATEALMLIDRLEKVPPEILDEKLQPLGLSCEALREFIQSGCPAEFEKILLELEARGMREFVEVDLGIVRGLAYYTGLVFEIFDRGATMRALAGGGRYDSLLAGLSDGEVDLPAIGFGMGDVTVSNLVAETPHALAQMEAAIGADAPVDLFVVIADESRRLDATALVQRLREAGLRVDFPFAAAKVGRQFQAAEQARARFAAVVGSEWPTVKLKRLATREETVIPQETLAEAVKNPHAEEISQ